MDGKLQVSSQAQFSPSSLWPANVLSEGVNRNINVTILAIMDPETGTLRRTGSGTKCDSRATTDPAYLRIIGEQAGSSRASMSYYSGLEWGYSSDVSGSTTCDAGFVRRNYKLTGESSTTFSILLGVAQSILTSLDQISQCASTSLTQGTCDVSR